MLGNLGTALRGLGRHGEALEHLERALAMMRAAGYAGGQADMLNGLGETHRETGRTERALEFHEEARAIAAREHWQRALAIHAEVGSPEADDIRVHLALHRG